MAALLAVCLILLTACGKQDSGNANSTPMGRYVEQEMTLPIDSYYFTLYFQQQADNSLLIIGHTKDSSASYSGSTKIAAWRSTDEGASWQEESFPWLKTLNDSELEIHHIILDKELTPYIYYSPFIPETEETASQGATDEDASSPSSETINEEEEYSIHFGRVTPNGIEPLDFDLNNVDSMQMMADGSLLYSGYEGTLYRAQPGKEQEILHTNTEIRFPVSTYFSNDTTVAVANEKTLALYDAKTLKLKEELPLTIGKDTSSTLVWSSGGPNQSAIAPGVEEGSICYANTSGIYQITPDGKINERIVDGSLSSLSIPSLAIMGIFPQPDDSYLIYFLESGHSEKAKLMRYAYDKDTIASPTTELRVFSLFDSPTIRQAVGLYQIQNPEVRVNYEVGFEPGSTDSGDVVTGLNTSLLAGDGPDILILDRLAVSEYADKGMLENLTPLLKPEVLNGLLPGPAATYTQGETTYAIPARFRMPVLFGSKEIVENCQTIPQLVQTMAKAETPLMGIPPEMLVFELYPFYQDRWYPNQKDLNWENLEADLKDIEQLAQRYQEVTIEHTASELTHIAGGWASDIQNIGLTYLNAMEDLAVPFSSQQEREGGILVPFPQQDTASFIPLVNMCLYADSQNQELAAHFMEYVLSAENQTYQVGDGLPVNKQALLANQVFPRGIEDYNKENQFGMYGFGGTNPYTGKEGDLLLEIYWPDEAYFAELNKTIDRMETPLITDLTMQEIIYFCSIDYMAGTKSLEDTLAEIDKTLHIYLAEQET